MKFIPTICRLEQIRSLAPKGIILSGGPASVYEENAPRCDAALFRLGIPILGICYGMQLMAYLLGGEVDPIKKEGIRESETDPGRRGEAFSGNGQKGKAAFRSG